MQIQIITTSIETKPTAKGSYQCLELVFKNLTFQGKVESKKLMSFGAGKPAFEVLSAAAAGTVFDISVVKNPAGFNDWTSATPAGGAGAPALTPAATPYAGKAATTTPKSTYETPEERAQRQILIVRQSSVSSAINLLGTGSKAPLKVSDVIATAKELESYVFGVGAVDQGPSGFDDFPDTGAEVF